MVSGFSEKSYNIPQSTPPHDLLQSDQNYISNYQILLTYRSTEISMKLGEASEGFSEIGPKSHQVDARATKAAIIDDIEVL